MKLSIRTLIGATAVFLLTVAGVTTYADMPNLVYAEGEALPAWISEETATKNGEPQWQLFAPNVEQKLREKIEFYSALPERSIADNHSRSELDRIRSECIWIGIAGSGTSAPGTFKSSASLSHLLSNSQEVFVGLIEEEQLGFLHVRPGTLYRVKVEQRIAGVSNRREPGDEVFVFYPEGIVRLGDHHFCSTAHRNFERPVHGKKILVFEYPEENQSGTDIINLSPDHAVFELPGSLLSWPDEMEQSRRGEPGLEHMGRAAGFDELVSWVERQAEEGGQR